MRATRYLRRGPLYDREWQRLNVEKGVATTLPKLRLTRSAPTAYEVTSLLGPLISSIPLFERYTVPTVSSVSGYGSDSPFDEMAFCEPPPEPVEAPPSLVRPVDASVGPNVLEQDASLWCPNHNTLLDAVVVVTGFECTDLKTAAGALTTNVHPPLAPWTTIEHDCVRHNVLPAITGDESEDSAALRGIADEIAAESSTGGAQKLVPSNQGAPEWKRLMNAGGRDARSRAEAGLRGASATDLISVARGLEKTLSAVEFVIGFSNTDASFKKLHRIVDDSHRRLTRLSFGVSEDVLERRLHPNLLHLARTLTAAAQLRHGLLACGSPSFFLSAAAWFAASGNELASVALPPVSNTALHEAPFELIDALAADASAVLGFIRAAAVAEGPGRQTEEANMDDMTSTELLLVLRHRHAKSRCSRRRSLPAADDDPLPRRKNTRPPHFVWQNFFLPGENLATLPPVQAFRELQHSVTAEACGLSTDEARRALQMQLPDGRDSPELYRGRLFIR